MAMTKKYKHRIDTMDGPVEYESDTPQSPHRTPEELEAERVRLYPSTEIADYLLYTCNYCLDQYYPMHPDRGENMNPWRGGYVLVSKDDKLRPTPYIQITRGGRPVFDTKLLAVFVMFNAQGTAARAGTFAKTNC
jgi:hypothetical protein